MFFVTNVVFLTSGAAPGEAGGTAGGEGVAGVAGGTAGGEGGEAGGAGGADVEAGVAGFSPVCRDDIATMIIRNHTTKETATRSSLW